MRSSSTPSHLDRYPSRDERDNLAFMRGVVLLLVFVVAGCAREPKPAPPDAETESAATGAPVGAVVPATPAAASVAPTLGRPCTSHAACSEGELCFTDTGCSAGSCQKAISGCSKKSCDCLVPSLCKTVCVDRGACVSCSMPPPPPS